MRGGEYRVRGVLLTAALPDGKRSQPKREREREREREWESKTERKRMEG